MALRTASTSPASKRNRWATFQSARRPMYSTNRSSWIRCSPGPSGVKVFGLSARSNTCGSVAGTSEPVDQHRDGAHRLEAEAEQDRLRHGL